MSPEIMDDPNNSDPIQPDPLLKPGAFIDPNPTPTTNGKVKGKSEPTGEPKQPSERRHGSSVEVTDEANRPEWLPAGWSFKEFLRTSGASAGSKDKYFIDPSGKRFRSKKEVSNFLETGTTPAKPKRKGADADADNTPRPNSETPNKRKKSEAKAKVSAKNFNFDDVPAKVKWEMTDAYDVQWRPVINSVERVPESSKQEWNAAFKYLTLQNGEKPKL